MSIEQQIIPAVKGIIQYNNHVLMLHRSTANRHGANIWEMPGGKMEFGEMPEESLHREVWEETGLTIQIDKLLYTTTFMANNKRHVVVIAYLCHSNSSTIQLSDEHQDYLWATKTDILSTLNPDILQNWDDYHVFKHLSIK